MLNNILKNNIENIAKQLGEKEFLNNENLNAIIFEVAEEFNNKINQHDQKTINTIAQEIYLSFKLGCNNKNISTNLKNMLKI